METELMTYENSEPLSGTELRTQVRVIQETMKAVMKDGEHYGVVPGCGNKPTLLKAGAEKLMSTFRLAANPDAITLFPGDEDKIGYRVTCRINSMQTGFFLGAGLGECSSEETKYKWRSAVCDAEFEATDETHRREKYKANGSTTKHVRTNPFDLSNTILKMAKKRALVDAVLTVCAASDIFVQDLDEDAPRAAAATSPEESPVAETEVWHQGLLKHFEVIPGKTGKKTWKRRVLSFEVEDGGPIEMSAFRLPEGWDDDILGEYAGSDNLLAFKWHTNTAGYKELTALAPSGTPAA